MRLLFAPLLGIVSVAAVKEEGSYVPDARPPPSQRLFVSPAVDRKIDEVAAVIADPTLKQMFRNTYASTLDTTVYYTSTGNYNGNYNYSGISFVVTGDIPAMWLRDSMNQVLHYIDVMQDNDDDLQAMIMGVVNLQASYILQNPYANAFKAPKETGIVSGDNWWATQDRPSPAPDLDVVWEMKYELDSLASFMRLAASFYNGASQTFKDQLVANADFQAALTKAMDVMDSLSVTTDHTFNAPYSWFRTTTSATETSYVNGRGNQGYQTGLVRSSFRPSDDSCMLPYLIPANCMAAAALNVIGGMSGLDSAIAARAKAMSTQIKDGVESSKVQITPAYRSAPVTIYPFETDGYGSTIMMDDANVPSLLSLPDLGYLDLLTDAEKDTYKNTRDWLLSEANPWFFKTWDTSSKVIIEGVGSPHTGPERVWPMSVAMRAITAIDLDPTLADSSTQAEVEACLKMLLAMNAGTGLMHEGVHVNNPNTYSRTWFAWANTVFGQLVLKLFDNPAYQDILKNWSFDASVLTA